MKIFNIGINKQNLTAAGRGEYAPIKGNDTSEGKAKNRRIEKPGDAGLRRFGGNIGDYREESGRASGFDS